ncbi:hypothetical protein [Lysinibacillus sphaericus]|uniref:Uncharacterized protein n=1 Tax=Lysinibacillus sphaericus OT4b.31 TaxID=1285586 RepID=R7Z8C4_LYSSH|nr:hypothetical protein [Lysinibacillus sphaericus]EON70181.1 hypothetical protein H131_22731 [Lysinibacillus sphaericus OT4b.31]
MNIVYRAAELLIISPSCDFETMGTQLSLLMLNKQVSQGEYTKLCALMDEQQNKVTDETQAEA